MIEGNSIIGLDDPILITGANGFIGSRVVETLLEGGFTKLRCFVRPSSNVTQLRMILDRYPSAQVELLVGNLLSREDCRKAARDSRVIYHLAAGIEKTFPGSFMNSVVTTRNLLDAVVEDGRLERFVNISSFAVYSNRSIPRGGLLDETCELENAPVERGEAYAFAKLKQDELLAKYGREHGVRYVIVRPGAVYGPGNKSLSGRVGVNTFGFFLHLGGGNRIPLTYVDNCADAIVLVGLRAGVDGEVFNIVDDELPTSREFLRSYKRLGKPFRSLYLPYPVFYALCGLWERYSQWSKGQLPNVFNRLRCACYWKGNRYSNQKLKDRLGWQPRVPFDEASRRYFESVRGGA